MAEDPRMAKNPGRVEHEQEIDEAIEAWTSKHDYDSVFAALEDAEVPAGPIYSVADISEDPQYAARKMLEKVKLPDGTPMRIPRMVPQLGDTPGKTRWLGPELGAHNEEVYGDLLGMDEARRGQLSERGII